MRYHSENIRHIRYLLAFPKPFDHRAKSYDFDPVIQCKVLALMLANATIATPILNRTVVKELLLGNRSWPKVDGSDMTISQPVDIAALEDIGLISFYADYCSLHRGYVHGDITPDESIKPILHALDMICDIIHGDDTINPHFKIRAKKANKLLRENNLSIDLNHVDGLVLANDHYQIRLSHNGGDDSLAEYLWKEFFPTKEVDDSSSDESGDLSEDKQARFRQWMLITRVYHWRYLASIDLECLDAGNRALFSTLALHAIANDKALEQPRKILERQWL